MKSSFLGIKRAGDLNLQKIQKNQTLKGQQFFPEFGHFLAQCAKMSVPVAQSLLQLLCVQIRQQHSQKDTNSH